MLLALLLAVEPPAPVITPVAPPDFSRTTDAEFCSIGKQLTASVTAELPVKVDAITRLDGMSLFCSLKTVAWNRFLSVDLATFREGWQARKQQQWNAVVCKNPLFVVMARRGWRFTQNLTFQSGERFVQDANCTAWGP